jgi:hypothetical protein
MTLVDQVFAKIRASYALDDALKAALDTLSRALALGFPQSSNARKTPETRTAVGRRSQTRSPLPTVEVSGLRGESKPDSCRPDLPAEASLRGECLSGFGLR